MLAIDKIGRITFVNHIVLSITDNTQEKILGKSIEDIFNIISDDNNEHKKVDILNKILEGGEYIYLKNQTLIVNINGKTIPIDINASPLRNEEGEINGAVIILYDITDRKQVEEAIRLRKEQEVLSITLNGNPIPTFVIDSGHRVVLWNRACELLTKVLAKDILNKQVDSSIFYPGLTRPLLADVVLDMDLVSMVDLYGSKNYSKSLIIPEAFEAKDKLTINGSEKDVYFMAARLRDNNGKVIGAIETLQDITEKEQLQRQLLQAQKMEAVGRLAGGIAHDFNNLLVVIKGYSDLLLNKLEKNFPLRSDIEAIKKAGERASALTRQLLAFSRNQVLQPKILDINEVVKDMGRMLHRLIGENINLITMLDPDLRRIKADLGQIEQIIMNLAVNARDAMPSGGELIIKTENVSLNPDCCRNFSSTRTDKSICISFIDNGIGMDKEILDHIFEPFFTTKSDDKGTGLGLSTVYGIIKQHKGCIKVESWPGKGTIFKVYFPALSIPLRDEINVLTPSINLKGNRERILLIEDEEDVAKFIITTLTDNDYIVVRAANVETAIKVFLTEKGDFALIFSDVVLPDKTGIELIDQLLIYNPDLRILFTSGYVDEKSQIAIIQQRMMPFLQKPYTVDNLLRAVKEAIGFFEVL